MDEHHHIRMRQLPGSPPDLLDQLKESIEKLFECSVAGAANYIQGRGEQESAKASEIKAKALAQLGTLELERQRLITERDKAIHDHKRQMYELKTKRLTEVVNCLTRLQEFGVTVNLQVVADKLVQAIDERSRT